MFNAYTTPTATCAAGNPTTIGGTGPWTWGCNSPNGGINTAGNACSANKSIDGVCNNGVQYACSVGTTGANVAGSCGGNSTWTCAGSN